MRLHYLDPQARDYDVFVNGKQIFDAEVADDERGYVLRRYNNQIPGTTYKQSGWVEIVLKAPVAPTPKLGIAEIRRRKAETEKGTRK